MSNARDLVRAETNEALLDRLVSSDPATLEIASAEAARRGLLAAAERLRPLLDAGVPSVRSAAADALGRLRDTASTGKLASLLIDAEQPATVRDTCGFALAQISDARAFDALAQAVRDPAPSVRICAAAGLAALRKVTALPVLILAITVEKDERVKRALYTAKESVTPRRRRRSSFWRKRRERLDIAHVLAPLDTPVVREPPRARDKRVEDGDKVAPRETEAAA